MVSRRKIILGSTTLAAAGALGFKLLEEDPVVRPKGVPLSSFSSSATAELVTQGIDLKGRRVLVTGATSGLGYETMRVLALRGAHVYGTGRTIEKAQKACSSIVGEATPLQLELTDFDSIAACAETFYANGQPLDVLVCNAGIMALPALEQVYGLEKQFVTNHLGHFLLTNLFQEQLISADQARVVVVSSSALKWAAPEGVEWDNLSGADNYDAKRAYGQSKLANCLFTIELARRSSGTNMTVNSLNPGVVLTDLQRHAPQWLVSLGDLLGPAFMKSPAEGASTSCYLATNPNLANVNGKYFMDCNPVLLGGDSENMEMAAKLWSVSAELVNDYLPEKGTI